jgi:hypothetical protein
LIIIFYIYIYIYRERERERGFLIMRGQNINKRPRSNFDRHQT